MIDLRQRLSELDQLEVPDMRADIELRAANLLALPRDPNLEPMPTPSPWRGPLIALGTAAAILAIVAGVAMLLLRDNPGEVTEQTVIPTPSTVAPPDTTVTPTTTPEADPEARLRGDALEVGWTEILPPNSTAPFTRLASGLWVGLDPGWLCRNGGYYASCLADEGADPVADPTEVLWTSMNGIDWTAHEAPEFVGMVTHYPPGLWGLQPLGGWLWVGASTLDEAASRDYWSRRYWITDDGHTWRQLEFGPSDPGPPVGSYSLDVLSRLDDVVFVTIDYDDYGGGATQHLFSMDADGELTEVSPFPEGEYLVTHWSANGELRAIVTSPNDGLDLWRSTDSKRWELLGGVAGVTADDLHHVAASSVALLAGRDTQCEISFDPDGADSSPSLLTRSLDGGLTWHTIDVFAAMPGRAGRPLIYQGCAFESIEEWFIVKQHEHVWVSRNGSDWYSIDANAPDEYGMSGSALYRAEGILVPPTK